ncbi:MAG: hypothetical protein OEX10_04990 [Candidatus Bathyarchaeota archaeon]|nr:hypothetical protein [Candidatus Bathyarchaeota archaeon]MDH5663684.1 hypothetical protein [Candidatus Bathyarchaeota archaeon]
MHALEKLEKETLYEEVKVPDYGPLNEEPAFIEVLQRLTSEDVIEVE